MRKLKILELFSGFECISNAFRARGHECFTIDWDDRFPSSMHCDISQLKIEDLPEEYYNYDWDETPPAAAEEEKIPTQYDFLHTDYRHNQYHIYK